MIQRADVGRGFSRAASSCNTDCSSCEEHGTAKFWLRHTGLPEYARDRPWQLRSERDNALHICRSCRASKVNWLCRWLLPGFDMPHRIYPKPSWMAPLTDRQSNKSSCDNDSPGRAQRPDLPESFSRELRCRSRCAHTTDPTRRVWFRGVPRQACELIEEKPPRSRIPGISCPPIVPPSSIALR